MAEAPAKKRRAADDDTARNYTITCGNPGAGKSTLLNGLAKQRMFKSGFASGTGLTYKLDIKEKDGITYLDTPGLADLKKTQAAAEAIRDALRKRGMYKILFVCQQLNGRIIPVEQATVKIVLEAAPEIGDKYGVIINQVPENTMKSFNAERRVAPDGKPYSKQDFLELELEDDTPMWESEMEQLEAWDAAVSSATEGQARVEFETMFFEGLPAQGKMFFVQTNDSLQGKENKLWKLPDELRAWIDDLPPVLVEWCDELKYNELTKLTEKLKEQQALRQQAEDAVKSLEVEKLKAVKMAEQERKRKEEAEQMKAKAVKNAEYERKGKLKAEEEKAKAVEKAGELDAEVNITVGSLQSVVSLTEKQAVELFKVFSHFNVTKWSDLQPKQQNLQVTQAIDKMSEAARRKLLEKAGREDEDFSATLQKDIQKSQEGKKVFDQAMVTCDEAIKKAKKLKSAAKAATKQEMAEVCQMLDKSEWSTSRFKHIVENPPDEIDQFIQELTDMKSAMREEKKSFAEWEKKEMEAVITDGAAGQWAQMKTEFAFRPVQEGPGTWELAPKSSLEYPWSKKIKYGHSTGDRYCTHEIQVSSRKDLEHKRRSIKMEHQKSAKGIDVRAGGVVFGVVAGVEARHADANQKESDAHEEAQNLDHSREAFCEFRTITRIRDISVDHKAITLSRDVLKALHLLYKKPTNYKAREDWDKFLGDYGTYACTCITMGGYFRVTGWATHETGTAFTKLSSAARKVSTSQQSLASSVFGMGGGFKGAATNDQVESEGRRQDEEKDSLGEGITKSSDVASSLHLVGNPVQWKELMELRHNWINVSQKISVPLWDLLNQMNDEASESKAALDECFPDSWEANWLVQKWEIEAKRCFEGETCEDAELQRIGSHPYKDGSEFLVENGQGGLDCNGLRQGLGILLQRYDGADYKYKYGMWKNDALEKELETNKGDMIDKIGLLLDATAKKAYKKHQEEKSKAFEEQLKRQKEDAKNFEERLSKMGDVERRLAKLEALEQEELRKVKENDEVNIFVKDGTDLWYICYPTSDGGTNVVASKWSSKRGRFRVTFGDYEGQKVIRLNLVADDKDKKIVGVDRNYVYASTGGMRCLKYDYWRGDGDDGKKQMWVSTKRSVTLKYGEETEFFDIFKMSHLAVGKAGHHNVYTSSDRWVVCPLQTERKDAEHITNFFLKKVEKNK